MIPSGIDLSSPEEVGQVRRSVAMLPARSKGVLDREEALTLLGALVQALRNGPRETPGVRGPTS